MNTNTHTPGPWKYSPYHRAILQDERSRDGCCLAICDMVKAPLKVNEANAALIAAAPDLLAALEELVECSPCPNNCPPDDMTCATNVARAAITKAQPCKR